jgi:Anti-sigma-K factor rskA/zinc-ribbon domain
MQCPRCNASLDEGAVFCGNCGAQVAPLQKGDNATIADHHTPTIMSVHTTPQGGQPVTGSNPPFAQRPSQEAFSQRSMPYVPQTPQIPQIPQTPPPGSSRPSSPSLRKTWRIAFIVGLVLVLIAAATIGAALVFKNRTPTTVASPPPPKANASGEVTFFDNPNGTPGFTDALKITAGNLSDPPAGSQYDAWMINDASEQVIPLGTLVKSGNTFSLNFTSGSGGTQQQLNLLGAGNRIQITVEQGTPEQPSGNVVLSGVFPPQAFVHIRHLLFSFPTTPGKIGLLVGLMRQTQALNTQAVLLQSFAGSNNKAAVQCVAQSIIDISEGTHGAHYHPLSASCKAITSQAGDGFGILGQGGEGYVATAAAHAVLAASQTDSTENIRLHAHHVEIATDNIKGWVTTVDQDAVKLLTDPSNTAAVSEIVTLSDHAFHGVAGPDGQVNPVPGEAGAITAYLHGQFMAILPIVSKT